MSLSLKKSKEDAPVTPETSGFPTVNLLPASIVEVIEQRRLVRRFAFVGGGVVIASVLLFAVQAGQIAIANNALSKAEAQTTSLTAEKMKYAPVADYYDTTKAQRMIAGGQLGGSVLNSLVLSKLSADMPPGVSLNGYSVTVAAGTNACPGPDPFTASETAGCSTLVGTAGSTESVGDLLNNLKKDEFFADPYVTSAAHGDKGVSFNGTVNLTKKFYGTRLAPLAATAPAAAPAPAPGTGTAK